MRKKMLFLSLMICFNTSFDCKGLLYAAIISDNTGDTKLNIASGYDSSHQDEADISMSFDNNFKTMYHSNFNNSISNYFPITLIYRFEKSEKVDYLLYYPRIDGNINGNFNDVDIYVKRTKQKEFEKVMSYDFEGSCDLSEVDFSPALDSVTEIKFIVRSGSGTGQGFASCAEMNFYRRNGEMGTFPKDLFTNETCSELQPAITQETINNEKDSLFRNLATLMQRDNYQREFRIQEFKATMNPDIQAKENACTPFSRLDNPTGIMAEEGKPFIFFAGKTNHTKVLLCIQNLDAPKGEDGYGGICYPVHEGKNMIIPAESGLTYLLYTSAQPDTCQPIKIHFVSGKVNGYFDLSKHASERWKEFLSKAGNKYFDVLGRYIHFTFETDDFRKYVADIVPLINLYDSIVIHEQEFEGLRKYNRMMKNRIYVNTSSVEGILFSAPYHIGFGKEYISENLDLNEIRSGWGFPHELGHQLQVRPAMLWKGMTEVTNNIQSMDVQRWLGNPSRLLTEVKENYPNAYEGAMHQAFVLKKPYSRIEDVFCQLVPFWQLRLYEMDILGKQDFYMNLYEEARKLRETEMTNGKLQLNFIYLCCKSAHQDLRPFFKDWGFMQPIHTIIDDYGKADMIITEQDIDEINRKIEALNLNEIPDDIIKYITDGNIEIIKQKKPSVFGTITYNSTTHTFKMKGFNNILAYELYCNAKLVSTSLTDNITLPNNLKIGHLQIIARGVNENKTINVSCIRRRH